MLDEPIHQQPSVSATASDGAPPPPPPPPTTGTGRAPGTLSAMTPARTLSTTLASPNREELQARADVQQMMQRLQNVLPFLALFALRYLYRHAVGIAFFVAYTLLVIKLSQQFRAQVALKGDQDSRVLWLVVAMSCTAIISACLLRASIGGGEEEESMFMLFYLPAELPTLEEVLWAILATDLCIRLLVLGLKAFVALHLPCRPLRMPTHWLFLSSSYFKGGKSGGGTAAGHHHHHHHSRLSRSTDQAGMLSLDASTSSLSSSSSSMSSSETGTTTTNRGARTRAASATVHPDDQYPTRTTSLYTRKRRVYCLLEALSLLARSLLPVPAWLRYYGADVNYGDVFVMLYLTLKCMVLSRHTRGVVNILASLCQSHVLEYGRPVTKEECQEAGATECVVCYESLNPDHSVALPCSHFFCESCLSEWCERERSCPLCRSAVQANFDNGGLSRSGDTPAWPCFL